MGSSDQAPGETMVALIIILILLIFILLIIILISRARWDPCHGGRPFDFNAPSVGDRDVDVGFHM